MNVFGQTGVGPGGAVTKPTVRSGGSSGGPLPLSTLRDRTPAPIGAKAGTLVSVMTPRQSAAFSTPRVALMQTMFPAMWTGPRGELGKSVDQVPVASSPECPFGSVVPLFATTAGNVPSGVGSGTFAEPEM